VCGKVLQLREAEEKLRSSESKLAFFQGKTNGKTNHGSNSLNHKNETPSKIHHQSKPQSTRLPDSAKASMNYSNYDANRSTFSTQRLPTDLDDVRGTKRKFGKKFISRVARSLYKICTCISVRNLTRVVIVNQFYFLK
jgi:hypothetical protein